MMTTAAEKVAVPEKKEEKVEKRRALGRGLESLLPGPRVVASPEPRVPSPETTPPIAKDAKDGAPGGGSSPVQGSGAGGETKVPRFARDDNGEASRGASSTSVDREESLSASECV